MHRKLGRLHGRGPPALELRLEGMNWLFLERGVPGLSKGMDSAWIEGMAGT